MKLVNSDSLDQIQKNYLTSLFNTLCLMTNKIIKRVNNLRQEFALLDRDFIMCNHVFVYIEY